MLRKTRTRWSKPRQQDSGEALVQCESQLLPQISCCQQLPVSSGGGCTTRWSNLSYATVPSSGRTSFRERQPQLSLSWAMLPSGRNVAVSRFPSFQHILSAALCFTRSSENLGSVGVCHGSRHISVFSGNINQADSCQLLSYGAKWNLWKYFRLCAFLLHPQMLGR